MAPSSQFWKRWAAGVGLALLAAVPFACAAEESYPDPGPEGHTLVVLPDGSEVLAEIARSDAKRARGLMFRERLGDDEGMLFVFRRPARHSFWMKNCLIPLDILWLDELGRVVHVEREVPPCTEEPCPSVRPPDADAAYALELAAGAAERHDVSVGDELILAGGL